MKLFYILMIMMLNIIGGDINRQETTDDFTLYEVICKEDGTESLIEVSPDNSIWINFNGGCRRFKKWTSSRGVPQRRTYSACSGNFHAKDYYGRKIKFQSITTATNDYCGFNSNTDYNLAHRKSCEDCYSLNYGYPDRRGSKPCSFYVRFVKYDGTAYVGDYNCNCR